MNPHDEPPNAAMPPRAILLCAGQGTRLLPLTLDIPKCLVNVGSSTILDHQIGALREAGIREITVVGGYRAAQLREHLAREAAPGLQLVINPFWSVASSIGSVWAVRDLLAGPFCLLNGDTIFDPGMVRQALADAQPGVNLVVEPTQVPEHDDMRVSVQGGRVLAVSKDIPNRSTTHRSLGIVICRDREGAASYLAALRAVIEEPDGHLAFHHTVIDHLAHQAIVTAITATSGLWREIDRPEDIERWLQERAALRLRAASTQAG
jgi:choline kinase